jgi:hypothetical protein
MQLSTILKDSDYRHAQFDLTLIYEFGQRISCVPIIKERKSLILLKLINK